MNIQEIQDWLNKEYAQLGTITIKEADEAVINPSDISYIPSIMDKIDPLVSDEPIIVEVDWRDNYILVDGYHRLKAHLQENKPIKVIVLKSFNIERNYDTLFSFFEKLRGTTVCFLDDFIFTANDKIYCIKENQGCGGCSNGWSSFRLEEEFLGKKIKIKKVESRTDEGMYEDEYNLFINNKLFAKIDTGWGNGYYGGDFEIELFN